MEHVGYLLSEVPFLVLIVAATVKLVSWRRARANRPRFSDLDRETLFRAPDSRPRRLQFYARFLLAVFAVLGVGLLQFIALAPFGAAVLTAALILSSAAIVRRLLLGTDS